MYLVKIFFLLLVSNIFDETGSFYQDYYYTYHKCKDDRIYWYNTLFPYRHQNFANSPLCNWPHVRHSLRHGYCRYYIPPCCDVTPSCRIIAGLYKCCVDYCGVLRCTLCPQTTDAPTTLLTSTEMQAATTEEATTTEQTTTQKRTTTEEPATTEEPTTTVDMTTEDSTTTTKEKPTTTEKLTTTEQVSTTEETTTTKEPTTTKKVTTTTEPTTRKEVITTEETTTTEEDTPTDSSSLEPGASRRRKDITFLDDEDFIFDDL